MSNLTAWLDESIELAKRHIDGSLEQPVSVFDYDKQLGTWTLDGVPVRQDDGTTDSEVARG